MSSKGNTSTIHTGSHKPTPMSGASVKSKSTLAQTREREKEKERKRAHQHAAKLDAEMKRRDDARAERILSAIKLGGSQVIQRYKVSPKEKAKGREDYARILRMRARALEPDLLTRQPRTPSQRVIKEKIQYIQQSANKARHDHLAIQTANKARHDLAIQTAILMDAHQASKPPKPTRLPKKKDQAKRQSHIRAMLSSLTNQI